jgi:Mg-chelatase subunit ChlD
MATKDDVLTILARSAFMSTEDLIALLGKSYAAVHTSLRRLSRRGTVVENANGTWSLASKTAAKPSFTPPAPTLAPAPAAPGSYRQAVAAAQPARKLRTKAILVVDDSTSVQAYRHEMAESINKTIADLKAEAYRSGQAIDMSLYYFANWRSKVEFRNLDVKEVKNQPVRYPSGGTPLFSAVEDAITDHLQPERADEDVAYLLMVITDGEDNESRDSSGNTMKRLFDRVVPTDRWTITFQMPPGKKFAFCNRYGISPGNCVEWELSARGLRETTVLRTSAIQNYTTSRAKGIHSLNTFYTDLSGLDGSDLRKNLVDIQSKVKHFTVTAETEIRPFVESQTGLPYEAGSVFYALTKPELVQDTKKLLIQEKSTRAIFAGNQARTLLGLPSGVDCKVKPGNHGNFDLYVQSTSVNRKLVRGTRVVHWPLSLQ